MKNVILYTDGACSGNPGPGGWASILRYGENVKELSGGEKDTTNNRMELTGVIEGLRALKEPCAVELYSDSQYIVNALNNGWLRDWKKRGWKRRDGELKKDNAGVVHQLKNMEDSTIQMAQSAYITLLALEEQSAALARQDAALDRTLAELELRYQLGQISTMTLEQAKAGKIQLESGKATLDMNITALRRQLNAMVGEELTAPLTLGALPAVTVEQLSAMDVEKDLEKAKAASYDLYAAKKTLDDADEEYDDSGAKSYYNERDYKKVQARHKWQSAQYTYNATVQKYELTFRSLCDKVKDCAQILSAAKVSLECERSDLAAAQLKYEQGTISENALHTAEDELYTAQDTVSGAERDLFTAYNNYRWAVDYGLLAG